MAHTDVGLIIFKTEGVTNAVGLGGSQGGCGKQVQDVRRAKAFDISNILDGLDPRLVDLVESVGIGLDGLVSELNAGKIGQLLLLNIINAQSLPEHLVRRFHLRVPIDGFGHIVDASDSVRDRGEVGKTGRGRVGSLLKTKHLGVGLLGGHVIVHIENSSGADASILRENHVAGGLDEIGDSILREDLQGAGDQRDVVGLQGELGDDSEVAAATLESPEELSVCSVVGDDLGAISENHVVTENVVHGEAILVKKIADTTDQGEAGDTNCLETTANGVLSVGCQFLVDIHPLVARSNFNVVIVGVDFASVQSIQGEKDTVVDRVGSGVLLTYSVSG